MGGAWKRLSDVPATHRARPSAAVWLGACEPGFFPVERSRMRQHRGRIFLLAVPAAPTSSRRPNAAYVPCAARIKTDTKRASPV